MKIMSNLIVNLKKVKYKLIDFTLYICSICNQKLYVNIFYCNYVTISYYFVRTFISY